MQQVILEVIKDLWEFTCHEFCNFFNQLLGRKVVPVIVPTKSKINENSFLSRPVVSPINIDGESTGWTSYVKVDITECFSKPEISFDSKICSYFFGDKVNVIRTEAGFSEVSTSNVKGWIKSDDITEDKSQVFPDLKHLHIYTGNDNETSKLRRIIKDSAIGKLLGLPLQSIEFALFVLKVKSANLSWPSNRPRLPGSWKTLLRGVKGVSLSLDPHTGAILEYAGDDGVVGFLGYVVAVRPDQSITIQSVGRVKEGEYRVEEFSRDEWKEWRPVYILF